MVFWVTISSFYFFYFSSPNFHIFLHSLHIPLLSPLWLHKTLPIKFSALIHQLSSLFTTQWGTCMVHIIYSYTFNVFLSYHSLFLTSHFPSPNFHLFFHSLHIPLVSPLLPLHSTLPTIFPIVSSIPLGLVSRSCGPLGWKSCLTDLPTVWNQYHREQSQGSCTV